jgi:hypothetical protein
MCKSDTESPEHVSAKSKNCLVKPLIKRNYLEIDWNRRLLLTSITLSRQLMTTGPLTLYFDHKGYHDSDGQSDSKLRDATSHRIRNLRAIKAFIMPALLLANLNAGVLIIAKTGAN